MKGHPSDVHIHGFRRESLVFHSLKGLVEVERERRKRGEGEALILTGAGEEEAIDNEREGDSTHSSAEGSAELVLHPLVAMTMAATTSSSSRGGRGSRGSRGRGRGGSSSSSSSITTVVVAGGASRASPLPGGGLHGR